MGVLPKVLSLPLKRLEVSQTQAACIEHPSSPPGALVQAALMLLMLWFSVFLSRCAHVHCVCCVCVCLHVCPGHVFVCA